MTTNMLVNNQLKLQVLCLIARWVEDPNSEAYKLHLARIPDYFWLAEDGLKFQVCINYLLQEREKQIKTTQLVESLCLNDGPPSHYFMCDVEFWLSDVGCCICYTSNPFL